MKRAEKRSLILLTAAAICFLLVFSACAKVGLEPAVTATVAPTIPEPKETESVNNIAPAETEAEPETGAVLARPIAYQVDLTHDQRPEMVVVDEWTLDDQTSLRLSVISGGDTVWEKELILEGDLVRRGYFLCSIDHLDYLMEYRVYQEETEYRYIGEVFYLNDAGETLHMDNDMLLLHLDSFDEFPLDVEKIGKFADWLNFYLDRSTLVCGNMDGAYVYSMADTQYLYTETFAELFSPEEEYADCVTLTDKIERLNTLLYRQWFAVSDDQADAELVKPEGFDETAERIVEAARPNIRMGEELRADNRLLWFSDYADRSLQIIRSENPIDSPIECDDVLFYLSEAEEEPGKVAQFMFERLIAEMTVPSELRTFVVTDYRIPEQDMRTLAKGLEDCWESYLLESVHGNWSLDSYIWEWLGYEETQESFLPVSDEMWYFIPQGYYAFSGTCGEHMTMEDMSADPRWVVGEKIPFTLGNDLSSAIFVLIREGDVYRLQRADAMAALYPQIRSD